MGNAAALALVSLIYAGAISALWLVFRRLGVARGRAAFYSLVTVGLVTGILAGILWPLDSSTLPNVYGVLLGDWLYDHTIQWIGDPHSDNAHETVPWLFRVPQVYVTASTALYAVIGLVLWLALGRSENPRTE